MQTEIIDKLDTFRRFSRKFSAFFRPCEIGFKNEFIISMYTRQMPAGTEVISYGKKFREIYFVLDGKIDMYKQVDPN